MPEQVKIYYKNATSDVVGFEHGISQDELDQLIPQIAQITDDMAAERQNGTLPYRDLPYQQEMVAQVKELADKYKGRFDNLVVLGIGGSALGNIALQTALNNPLYNLEERKIFLLTVGFFPDISLHDFFCVCRESLGEKYIKTLDIRI